MSNIISIYIFTELDNDIVRDNFICYDILTCVIKHKNPNINCEITGKKEDIISYLIGMNHQMNINHIKAKYPELFK